MNKKIGYLGPEGTNSHEAAESIKGADDVLIPLSSFEIGLALQKRQIDKVVLPVENSGEGKVKWVFDELAGNNIGPFNIIGEIILRVKHCLIGFGKMGDVTTIYSHPQALGQCRKFINGRATRDTDSTSAAVKTITNLHELSLAAIGTKRAANKYEVPIIQENIGDNPINETRFIVLGEGGEGPTGNDKTSIIFGVENKEGSLVRLLSIFLAAQANMTMITSEPSHSKILGEYIFFVDVAGHQDDRRLSIALEMIRATGSFLKVLGSYPRAITALNTL